MVLRFSIPRREISVAYNKVFILWSSPGVLNTITSQAGQGQAGWSQTKYFPHPAHTASPLLLPRSLSGTTLAIKLGQDADKSTQLQCLLSQSQSQSLQSPTITCKEKFWIYFWRPAWPGQPRDDPLAVESSQCFVWVKLGNQFHAIFQFLFPSSHHQSPSQPGTFLACRGWVWDVREFYKERKT